MTYSEKLLDPRWQKKRLEILQRDNFTCSCCGDTKETLHVHHVKYNGEPWDIDSSLLITFCATCHFFHEFYKGFIIRKIKKCTNKNDTITGVLYCDDVVIFSEYKNNDIINHIAFTNPTLESVLSELQPNYI